MLGKPRFSYEMAKHKSNSEVVHVGIDFNNAVMNKKEVLLTQTGILQAIKHMREYSILRKKEFAIKTKLKKSIKEMEVALKHIESNLPKQDEIKILKKQKQEFETITEVIEESKEKQEKKIEREEEKLKERQKNMQIEDELAEIQAQLDRLG